MNQKKKFDIALSFAGEDREYVERVATLLQQIGVSVFYDSFEEANLWGKNLYDYLSDIYKNQARYTIVFISESYNKKLWTNHERQSMQSRAFQENKEYILPVRFDDTTVPGILPTTGYIDLRTKTPEELVELIKKKLIYSGGTIPSDSLRSALSTISLLPKIEPKNVSVKILQENNTPIINAKVVLSADNGTYLQASTNDGGIAEFSIKTQRSYSLLVAHENYPSALVEKFDCQNDIEIKLTEIENIGSIIIQSTGYIKGLNGRLNPINDSNGRTYLYADNISINNGAKQPVTFGLNKNLILEDNEGVIMNLIFRFIGGHTTALIDYIKPKYEE